VGYAIFVTNNAAYKREKSPKLHVQSSRCRMGRMLGRNTGMELQQVAKDYPDFELCQEHDITWHDATLGGIPFYYCMVKV